MANSKIKNKKTTHQKLDLPAGTFDKLQPQARDLEEVVLGGMMLDKDAVSEVIELLSAKAFYVEAHKLIYEAIKLLFAKSEPVDIMTVIEKLRSQGNLEIVGGPFYITQLTNRVGSTANIAYHSRIIMEKHIMRELIRTSSIVQKEAYEETTDVFELLDKAEQNLFNITEQNLGKSDESMSDLGIAVLKKVEAASKSEGGVTGIPSGLHELDRMTAGWQKSDLVILAARPGMGKTALALNIASNAALHFNKPVAIFSLEMPSVQLVMRVCSSISGISGEKLKKGELTKDEWKLLSDTAGVISEVPLYISDKPAINIFELRAKCRRLKMQHDIQMIVIDYLQLMSGSSDDKAGNREQEISTISRSLKTIAKELEVPVIALSQLSRAVETRGGDKRPQLSDLRESGAIEQDSDMVIFLYRPEYYGFDQDDDGNNTKGKAEIIIAKHRNGALGTVNVRFVAENARFENYNAGFESLNDLNAMSDDLDLSSLDIGEDAPF